MWGPVSAPALALLIAAGLVVAELGGAFEAAEVTGLEAAVAAAVLAGGTMVRFLWSRSDLVARLAGARPVPGRTTLASESESGTRARDAALERVANRALVFFLVALVAPMVSDDAQNLALLVISALLLAGAAGQLALRRLVTAHERQAVVRLYESDEDCDWYEDEEAVDDLAWDEEDENEPLYAVPSR